MKLTISYLNKTNATILLPVTLAGIPRIDECILLPGPIGDGVKWFGVTDIEYTINSDKVTVHCSANYED